MAKVDKLLPGVKMFSNYSQQTHSLATGKLCNYSPYEEIFEKAEKIKLIQKLQKENEEKKAKAAAEATIFKTEEKDETKELGEAIIDEKSEL